MAIAGNLPDVDYLACDSGGGHHCRTHEQGTACRAPLPAFEVPVRGRRANLSAFEPILVHREAHRAAGAAPVEASLDEHAIQPLTLRREADRLRSRHGERLDVRRYVASLDHPRCLAEIREARVRTRSDERHVDLR